MKPNEKLKKARERANYTQMRLSEEIGVPQTTLSAYERGALLPSAVIVGRLRLALDIRHAYEIGYDVTMETVYTVRRIDG
jgi:DNA-binding XRE family transcriptional regulator